jgi:hypothetical protein
VTTLNEFAARRSEEPPIGLLKPTPQLLTECSTRRRRREHRPATLPPVIDEALRAHFESGVSVIVGTVSTAGAPLASEGFGVVPVGDDLVQVFLDASEGPLLDNIRGTGRVAVTTADVYTFQSVQLKGRVESLDPSTVDEYGAAVTLTGRFNEKIARLQDLPSAAFDRQTPAELVTCTARIHGVFDQSPGPKAGTPLAARGR